VAAAGLTICGVTAAIPEPTPVELKSFTYGGNPMNNPILIAYAYHPKNLGEISRKTE
jgi:hypothetical protein